MFSEGINTCQLMEKIIYKGVIILMAIELEGTLVQKHNGSLSKIGIFFIFVKD